MRALLIVLTLVLLSYAAARPMTQQAFHYNLALYTVDQLGTIPTRCQGFTAQDPNTEWMCAQFNFGAEVFIPNWDRVIASGLVQSSYNIAQTSDWQAYYAPNGLLAYYAKTYSFHGGTLTVAYAPFAFYREIHIGFQGVPTIATPAPEPTQVQQQVVPAPVQQQAPRQSAAPAQQAPQRQATPAPTPTPQPAPEPQRATPAPQAAPAASFRFDPFGPDRNCGDFGTQREAQAFFEAAGGPGSDRHRLDRDGNGLACESRP